MQNGRIACTLSALLGISFTAQAETLLIDRVKINPAAAPMRGPIHRPGGNPLRHTYTETGATWWSKAEMAKD